MKQVPPRGCGATRPAFRLTSVAAGAPRCLRGNWQSLAECVPSQGLSPLGWGERFSNDSGRPARRPIFTLACLIVLEPPTGMVEKEHLHLPEA